MVSFLLKGLSAPLDRRVSHASQGEIVISSVVEGELLFGIALLPPAAKVRPLLLAFLAQTTVLPWTSGCARMYGSLAADLKRKGKPMSFADTMIAAHALTLNLVLATNDKAFARVPSLRVEDWTAA